jgi:N-acetylmuramic acid 6-phosphate etherase
MIRFGRTYSNLMVSMRATNAKLRGRTLRILHEATGADIEECGDALAASDGDLKVALVHLLSGVDTLAAGAALADAQGHVRHALAALGG